jgi:hypothetical protein
MLTSFQERMTIAKEASKYFVFSSFIVDSLTQHGTLRGSVLLFIHLHISAGTAKNLISLCAGLQ